MDDPKELNSVCYKQPHLKRPVTTSDKLIRLFANGRFVDHGNKKLSYLNLEDITVNEAK